MGLVFGGGIGIWEVSVWIWDSRAVPC